MSDFASFVVLCGAVAVGGFVGAFLSDWIGGRRFSKRLSETEAIIKDDRDILVFVIQAMNAAGVMTIERNGKEGE